MSKFEEADQPELDALFEQHKREFKLEELERLGKFIGRNLLGVEEV